MTTLDCYVYEQAEGGTFWFSSCRLSVVREHQVRYSTAVLITDEGMQQRRMPARRHKITINVLPFCYLRVSDGGRVSRRLCRRSEIAGAVRWRRKAEIDRVCEGISEGFRSTALPQPLHRREASNSPPDRHLFFLRLQHFLPLLEHPVDRLRGTGIQAEAAAFQATRRVELVGRG